MLAAEKVERPAAEPERRFLLHDVPWWAYVALRDTLEGGGTRMTYLEGSLELFRPSETHEEETKLIARLLEAWADYHEIDLCGFGSTTYRREIEKRGLEPDECYTVGPKVADVPPQIAIEVVVSSPLLDKLEVYAGLGVLEVWVWNSRRRELVVHRLAGGRYTAHDRSQVLPGLDPSLFAAHVRAGESHTALVKQYRAALG